MFKPFAVAAVVVAGLMLAPSSLFAQTNTRIGTWKLNLAKSKFEHGPAPKSALAPPASCACSVVVVSTVRS